MVGGWVDGWIDGWEGGREGAKASLRIAYSNQQMKSIILIEDSRAYKANNIPYPGADQ